MKTLTEIINEELNEIHKDFSEMDANQCSIHAMKLSSLLATILTREAEMESACAGVKMRLLPTADSISAAEAGMKATQEYADYLQIRAIRVGVTETIRSLKARIRVKIEERKEFTPS